MTLIKSGLSLAIVGAGPGGLTSAIAAARGGLQPTVFERAEALTAVGGGIVLHSNGLRVLERLGLLESFAPMMFPCRRLVLQLGDRRELVNDYSALPVPQNYFAVVLRHQLQTFLLAAAERVAIVRFGRHCTTVEEHANHVQLRFEAGDAVECAVALGADGAHSKVRESLPIAVTTQSTGDAYLRGVSECKSDAAEVREIWGVDGRRFGIAPLAQGRTYFYCSAPRGQWQEVRSTRLEAWINSWRPFGPQVRDVLHHVTNWQDVNYDEPEQVRVSRWYSGRTLLIGDAAHAMTPNYGQGANAAMVDAVVVTALLARSAENRDSLTDVGAQYESIRRRFVDRTQAGAWRLGLVAQWKSPAMQFLRDSAFSVLSRFHFLSRRDLLLAAGYNPVEDAFLERSL
jgi:2-polyprenyl-6-methoxyphenol hydroxylase-like FAD-dependent oxidoreductase